MTTIGKYSGLSIGKLRSFKIEFSNSDIEELQTKLHLARFEQQGGILPEENDKEEIGIKPSTELLKTFVKEWQNFDFNKVQIDINKFQHFLIDIDWCKPLHFLHKKSSKSNAIPLMLIHGWPGSFYEFYHVIEKLSEPENSNDQAFHLIIPSLPGFAYSKGPPTKAKGDQDAYAKILDALMMDVLHYTSYACQGGDWGSAYARTLAAKFCRPNSSHLGCRAVHLNFSPVVPMYVWALDGLPNLLTVPLMPYIPGERGNVMRKMWTFYRSMAYYWIQATRPAQLATGLADSPIGLLSWLSWFWALELNTTPTFNSTMMLTISTIYFFTRCIGTSFLPYHNNQLLAQIHGDSNFYVGKNKTKQKGKFGARLGYSDFPRELINVPFAWMKSTGDLQFYVKATSGGHFASTEEPEIFINHLRIAFSNDEFNNEISKDNSKLLKNGIHDAHISGSLWPNELRKAIKDQVNT